MNHCFQHDGIGFNYRDAGDGLPFIFQHGLGGDVNQPFGLFQPPPGIRMVAFDCRAHGETRPLGDPEKISFNVFADDLRALMDHLRLEGAVVGGISMGAAVALNFTLRYPDRVLGLVLSRPAWLASAGPPNLAVYDLVAQLIRQYGAQDGLAEFKRSADYAIILRESPDAASSLVGQFEHPRAEETVIKLERIPHDAPIQHLDELWQLKCLTLVLANRMDPVHPFDYGVTLAQSIKDAEFEELTPKSVSKERHTADVQRVLSGWLGRCQDRFA